MWEPGTLASLSLEALNIQLETADEIAVRLRTKP